MNYDENTREGRHLTPEERIALQAEEIKQLWQENEQLRARVAQYREAIKGYSTCPYCWGVNGHAKGCKFYEALQNIDALIGGKEDV